MRRILFALLVALCGCGSNQNQANRLGVGADCTASSECLAGQVCLTEFKGGYCGVSSCGHDGDCPQGSACVTDGQANYCFLVCAQKTDCNLHRTVDDESDCTSSLTFLDGTMSRKVCRPPNSGTVITDAGRG